MKNMDDISFKEKILAFFVVLVLFLPILIPAYIFGEFKEKNEMIDEYKTTIEEYEMKIYDLEAELEETENRMLKFEEENYHLKNSNDELSILLDELYIKHGYYNEEQSNAGTWEIN